MLCEVPDRAFFRDLEDLNVDFLGLLQAHPRPGPGPVLGLDAALAEQLRRLSPAQLDFIAATPCLLAAFADLPSVNVIAEPRRPKAAGESQWFDTARLFAASMLVQLRQAARRDRFEAALCLGPAIELAGPYASLSLRDIQTRSSLAANLLRVQFAGKPRFWPDLLRAASTGNRRLRDLACLSSIPLALKTRSSRSR